MQSLRPLVLSSALPVVSMTCMTFDEVVAPAHLSGGPSPATKIPVVHTLLMQYSQLLILSPRTRKRYEKNGRVAATILVQKSAQ